MKARVQAPPPDLPPKAFFSPRDYARLAGIHPSTVLDQIHSGKLYAIKLSQRVYRIPRAVVVSTLYPEMIPPMRIRHSPDLAAELEAERREIEAEAEAALAARRARKADAASG